MAAEWFLTDGSGLPAWADADLSVAPGAPASVVATPTGGTTALIEWVGGAGGSPDAFDVEVEIPAGSGNWFAVSGAANPTLGSAASFTAAGLLVFTSHTPRVRAKKAGFSDSAWTVGAAFLTDNSGTGGAVIGASDATAPSLTGSITISALTSVSYTAQCPPASDAVGVTGYQWRLGGSGGWADIPSGGRSIDFAGRTPASTDALEMRARDAAGNFSAPLSTAVTLAGVAPVFTAQPASQSIAAGSAVSFTAAASGAPAPAFQWFRNGLAIAGATSATYTFIAQLTDTGAVFVCQAINSAGTLDSSAAVLTVTALATAPSIGTQPASQTVEEGGSVTFSAVVLGTNPLAYQWLRNGTPIPGATAASYTFVAALADSGASFSLRASNGAGTVDSAAATLVVTALSALTPYEAFMPFVLSRAKGCPWELARQHVVQSAIDWFNRTLAWRVGTTTATVEGLRNYGIPLPAGVKTAKLLQAWVNGIEVTVPPMDAGTGLTITGTQAAVWTEDRATFNVNPLPGPVSAQVRLQLAVKPSQDSTAIPTAQFEQYADQIADGALARLLRIQGKDWTDTDGAAFALADYEMQVGKVTAEVATAFSRAQFRVKPSYF